MQIRVFILADFSKFPTKNSSNNNITAAATTTPPPNAFLTRSLRSTVLAPVYIRQLLKKQNRCGSAVLSVKVKEGAVLLSMAALQDNTMRAARATSLSTWRPCDGTRRTATSHLVIHAKADPAGVPGSCHYQLKVGIQHWTLFYAFEHCRCTATHGYS